MNKGGAMPHHICVIIDAEKAQVMRERLRDI